MTRKSILTFRKSVAFAAAISMLGLTAACSSPSSNNQPEDGPVEIRFSWWGNATRADLTTKAIKEFEAANPNIKVKPEYGDISGYFDKLATQVAANDAPDVITMGGAYPAEYANRGALLDLSKVSGSLDLTKLDQGAVENGQVKGTQYGVSTGANALAVVVNPAVFTAAGVELPDDSTWSWDDFASVAKNITEKSPKGTYGTATVLTHDSLDAFARQRGKSLYTQDGQLGLDKDTVQAYFDYSLKLSESGAAPSASETVEKLNASTEQTLMGMGQAGMMLTWSNSLTALSKASGAELKLLKLPGEKPTPGIWLQSSQFYTISARSKHTDAAAKLVNFLVNNEAAAKIIQSDRGVPSNSGMRSAIGDLLTPQGKTEAAYIDEVGKMDFAPTFIGPTGSTAVSEITARLNTDVLFKRLSPEKAAEQWINESKAAIGK
ncbi:ABC transporter substrate-binding protein [Paenarthrobacter ilicis]|uniref:Multiple sugar transport system substrate-binding protein n=1 Tax=Paenarthrobacter ilicis TaxID=43665 RepID=A0ABX0TE68_9MICC|nr:extracellular solute-binding protein [Paenarthrobacter ilicis]MBM7792488.1 multiple sugar transport system substrate-binding protein [Paenarthrobacter ilicis]NIJ00832.1 multiple sugar transport system substrate-binding protein [Paenarthrobacter ilicis]